MSKFLFAILLLVVLGAMFVYAVDTPDPAQNTEYNDLQRTAVGSIEAIPSEEMLPRSSDAELVLEPIVEETPEAVEPPLPRTSLLLAESIIYASENELVNMCKLRGLDTSGTEEQLRERLLDYHGLKESELQVAESDSDESYDLEILSAQRMRSAGNLDDLVVLEGNVTISFTPSGEDSPKALTANRMVIDLANTRLTAMGDVTFTDKAEDSAVQDVSGDIVSLDWRSGNLEVSGGTTSAKKKNSDDKDVEFFTSGTQINYRGDSGGIQIQQGFITTNPDTAYSSITAKSLSMLPGGDMFVSNAYLSIGRVPVFWVPFFFYPGATLVFNPAFGFASERGMFLNTTYEIYGSYPKFKDSKQSSFSSLLATQSDGPRVKDGIVYTDASKNTESADGLQAWAEKSGSYLALLGDVYQNAGIFGGFDSSTNLWNKTLVIDANGGVAVTPTSWTKNNSGNYPIPKFRYMGNLAVKLDTSIADLTIAMPLYSDPAMQRLYGNRLTSFSMDALFGSAQEFPTDYSGDITTYTWRAGGKLSLPRGLASPYITRLELSKLDAAVTFQWLKDISSDPSGKTYSYKVSSMTLPDLSASMSGTLFSLEKKITPKDDSSFSKNHDSLEEELYMVKEQARKEQEAMKDDSVDASTVTDEAVITDEAVEQDTGDESSPLDTSMMDEGEGEFIESTTEPVTEPAVDPVMEDEAESSDPYEKSGLPALYQPASTRTGGSAAASGSHNLSLSYTLNQTLTNKYAAAASNQDSVFGPQTLYAATKGDITLTGNIAPSLFSFSEKISPSLTISEEEANNNYSSTQMQLTSSTTASLPFLGLKYELVTKLYNYRKIERDNVTPDVVEQWAAWDSNFVTTHRLSLTRAFSTSIGTFTPSVTGTLPPLRFSLLPAVAWRYGGWVANASYKFVDDGNGNMKSDLISLTLGYDGRWISTSFTGNYQTASYDSSNGFWDPFTLKGSFALNLFNKSLIVKQSVDFAVASSAGRNMFNSLVSSVSYQNSSNSKSTATASVTFAGPADALKLSSFDITANLADLSFSWWKRRISLGFTLGSALHFDFLDKYSSNLSVTAKVDFSIAEFLSLSMSVTSSNNGFFSYYDDAADTFSWTEMFEDLMRSFDFFGNGRSMTQFNMESFSIELIHYMNDWDLHCKYTGSVVLSGYDWKWVPRVSIFLQWKTIPELKVDEKWTQDDSGWIKGT